MTPSTGTFVAIVTPALDIIDGQITTTSLQVAENFSKRHDNVLKAIRNLECSPEFYLLNFEVIQIETDLGMGRTRKDPAYRITRDGFVFLAMGFKGKEAAQWKEAYITTFNRMEAQLLARQQDASLQVQNGMKAQLEAMTWDYLTLQRQLIESQGRQIRLMKRWSARQAHDTIIQMSRDGMSNAQIVAATGRNHNHVRQVQWQARAAGTLPPLPKDASAQQTGLFAEAA